MSPADEPMKRASNRLMDEKSPYLLQHAHNPVNWYPWGDEAFQKAKKEDKPIFLSIGYATCHWCHVMAHESFEDDEVAELLNQYFIAIKVDREERPDVDKIYMFYAPKICGGGIPVCGGKGINLVEESIKVTDISVHRFADDVMIEGYLKNAEG